MSLTFLDIVLIVVFVLGILTGASQGMVRQLFSFAGLFFGVIIASQRHQDLASFFSWIDNPDWVRLASFAVITLAVLVAATFVGAIVRRVMRLMALGCLDWLGGGIIGAIETLLLVDVALILIIKYPVLGLSEVIRESRVPSVVLKLAPGLMGLLPPEFDVVRGFFQ